MPTVAEVFAWFTMGGGRPIGAASLTLLMWAVKSIPHVEQKLLTTPRRKMAANAFLALGPAVYLLADDSVPWASVLEMAFYTFTSAMGLHVVWKVGVLGKPVGDKPQPPQE